LTWAGCRAVLIRRKHRDAQIQTVAVACLGVDRRGQLDFKVRVGHFDLASWRALLDRPSIDRRSAVASTPSPGRASCRVRARAAARRVDLAFQRACGCGIVTRRPNPRALASVDSQCIGREDRKDQRKKRKLRASSPAVCASHSFGRRWSKFDKVWSSCLYQTEKAIESCERDASQTVHSKSNLRSPILEGKARYLNLNRCLIQKKPPDSCRSSH